jgi:hypothetical protein
MKRGDILMGVGAGLVSAVLFATVIRGSLAGILLFYLTPLPVAIVALGWNHRSGLVASGVGALAVGLVFAPLIGFLFAVTFALPLWWLAFLSLLARQGPAGDVTVDARPATQWYPLGGLAVWAGGLAVLLTLGLAVTRGLDYEAYRSSIEELVRSALKTGLSDGIDELPGLGANALSAEGIANFMANYFMPSVVAAALTLLPLVILLVAAKLVSLSGRLPRPLPHVAREFVLPRATLIGLGAFRGDRHRGKHRHSLRHARPGDGTCARRTRRDTAPDSRYRLCAHPDRRTLDARRPRAPRRHRYGAVAARSHSCPFRTWQPALRDDP